MTRHVVAMVGEISPGTCKIVSLSGREIGIFNVNGAHYALIHRYSPGRGASKRPMIGPQRS